MSRDISPVKPVRVVGLSSDGSDIDAQHPMPITGANAIDVGQTLVDQFNELRGHTDLLMAMVLMLFDAYQLSGSASDYIQMAREQRDSIQ